MKKVFSYLMISLTLMFTSAANAGLLTIDDFSDDQGPIAALVGQVVSDSVLGSMIGGERDLIIETYSALFDDMGATGHVTNGAFSFNSDSSATSQFTIQWDGIDGSGDINANGLADAQGKGIDLSNFTSFATTTLFADFDYFFETTVWWANGTQSETVSLLGPGNQSFTEQTGSFSFSLFENADFTDVSALQVVGNSMAPCCYTDQFGQLIPVGSRKSSFDVTVSQVTAVPEPSSAGLLGLAGLACIGMGAYSRRKEKKNT